MDTNQVLITAGVGLVVSVVTALITHALTRAQERRKHEREVAEQLAQLKSTERSETMIMAVQFGHSCFVIERSAEEEKDRVFLPMGSRIAASLSEETNRITLFSSIRRSLGLTRPSEHKAMRPMSSRWPQPLGVAVNGTLVVQPRRLATGDVITLPGTTYRITFVRLVA